MGNGGALLHSLTCAGQLALELEPRRARLALSCTLPSACAQMRPSVGTALQLLHLIWMLLPPLTCLAPFPHGQVRLLMNLLCTCAFLNPRAFSNCLVQAHSCNPYKPWPLWAFLKLSLAAKCARCSSSYTLPLVVSPMAQSPPFLLEQLPHSSTPYTFILMAISSSSSPLPWMCCWALSTAPMCRWKWRQTVLLQCSYASLALASLYAWQPQHLYNRPTSLLPWLYKSSLPSKVLGA